MKNKQNQILSSMLTLIKSNSISTENIKDILIITKGAINSNNVNLELINTILQAIIKQSTWDKEINNLLFINFFCIYKYIINQSENKKAHERKLLLLIEYYLMLDFDMILK